MPSDLPLVSAIMPTRGRAGWAQDAVRMFQQQTYPNKELVIVDDMMEPSFPGGLSADGVLWFRAPRHSLGEKRNLAVSRSRGDVIVHWDSDDLYMPDRIEHQVAQLLQQGVDLTGYHAMLFEDPERGGARWRFTARDKGYAVGVSMCYWRDTWEKRRFNALDTGEDNQFLEGRNVYCCDSGGRIVARIHNGNTSEKRSEIAKHPQQWERIS